MKYNNADEMQQICKHPELGYSIVVKVPFLKECAEILLQHHERYDGSGYPKGLIGTDIMLEARIIAVADAFDAMTSVRPYRNIPLTKSEAVEQLLINSGTQFDANTVECFVKMVASHLTGSSIRM
ncbi:MAG: HD domain-containing protein [Lachnospiraceae bacterium]|nr:HD domain-containing protein [Lachnospiraceae bacterium]